METMFSKDVLPKFGCSISLNFFFRANLDFVGIMFQVLACIILISVKSIFGAALNFLKNLC